LWATIGLVVLALLWGYNWVVMKVAVHYSQPFALAAMRACGAALFLFLVMLLMRRRLRPKALGLTAVVGLLQTAGFLGLAMWALVTGGAGKTSVLVYIMPFWLLLMAWAGLGEKLRGLQWVSLALALAGLLFILSPWNMKGSVASTCLAVGAGISWAGSAVAAKVLHKHHAVDLLSLTAWQMLLGSVPLIIVAALTYETAPIWSGSFIAALVFNVVPGTGLALVVWFYVLRALPAGTAGIGTLATPVVGVAAAWIQLGERPSSGETAGMFLIVAALALLVVREMAAARRSGKEQELTQRDEAEPATAGLPRN
jgi:drug/metabolite transporter (DMT)-like permease